tara:strand:- start:6197 stop:7057 length:861 start_codon:yes stop_codon:yes gene_type:complete
MFTLFNVAATVIILSKSEQSALCRVFQDNIVTDDEHNIVECNATADRALDGLTRANLRLAVKVAKKHVRDGIDIEDLTSEAIAGLCRAAVTFNPDKGASFTSYARQWMVARCQEYVQANAGLIRIGTRTGKALWAGLQKARRALGAEATCAEIAAFLDLETSEVEAALPLLQARGASLDKPLSDDGGTIADLYECEQIRADEALERTRNGEKVMEALTDFMEGLNDRHADVFRRRILADYAGTDKASPSDFGVTKQRVSQIEKSVIKKLQAFLADRFGADLQAMMG